MLEGGLFYLAVSIVCAFLAEWWARTKGYSTGIGFIFGFLLGPLGMAVAAPIVADFSWVRPGKWKKLCPECGSMRLSIGPLKPAIDGYFKLHSCDDCGWERRKHPWYARLFQWTKL